VAVSSGTPLPPVLGAPYRFVRRLLDSVLGLLDDLGAQLSFYARSLGWTYRVLLRYKKEVIRLLAEVSLGSGAPPPAGRHYPRDGERDQRSADE